MRTTILCLSCLWLSGFAAPAAALELFGVTLESSQREELRAAARGAGLVLIREGGDDNWFDMYDSREVLEGSRYCYLGFVKQSREFAFVEYEFHGLDRRALLARMRARYGEPGVVDGDYPSDRRHVWQRDGIEITLAVDWSAYRTRLTYIHPENMERLVRERRRFLADRGGETAEAVAVY